MARALNIAKLRRLGSILDVGLPRWTFQVYTQKEVAERELLDPPCAILEGRWGPFHLEVDVDGEVYVQFKMDGNVQDGYVGKVDLSQRVCEVQSQILQMITAEKPPEHH